MDQHDGRQLRALHQRAAGFQRVVHGGQRLAASERQHEVVRAGMGHGRWNAGIEIARRVAEQGQRIGDQFGCRRHAVRGRRLQRGGDHIAIAPAFHRDLRLVERQCEHAVAALQCERGAQRNGGVAAERHFGLRREVAHAPAVAGGCGEGGFRKADLCRDALHPGFRWQCIANDDAGRVAARLAIREGCDLQNVHGVFAFSGAWVGRGRAGARPARASRRRASCFAAWRRRGGVPASGRPGRCRRRAAC